MRHPLKHLLPLILLSILTLQTSTVLAQGTAFTYQGHLNANGGPANGLYDFQFQAFDAASAGNAVGPAFTTNAVTVTNGMFTATPDLGGSVFTGPARWLEVAVRSNGTGNFTALSPLQLLTPAPYAIAAGNLLGTLPASQLPNGVVLNNQSNLNLSGAFSGNGSGLSNTPGTVVWQAPSITTLQAQANTAYLLTNSQLVTLTLPASPNVGDVVQIVGVGGGGWILSQNPGQSVSGAFTPLWPGIGAPLAEWSAIASSSDGTKLAASAFSSQSGDVYTSTNSGTNWTQELGLPGGSASSIASSSDGTKLAAVYAFGGIYTSINSGSTWTLQSNAPETEQWHSIASSSNGTKLAAVAYGGGIYTSINSGTNWTLQANAPETEWYSIASSSDGTKLAAVPNGGGIYTSINSGTNWTLETDAPDTNDWISIASSSDGTKLAAVSDRGEIYTSIDSGATWLLQTNAPYFQWLTISTSSDGNHLVASGNGGGANGTYTSVNSGTNWTLQTNIVFNPLVSSSDGSRLAGAGSPNGGLAAGIYTSINAGTNWTLQAGPPLASTSTATTIGTAGFLEGVSGASIELIYTGGGRFIEVSGQTLSGYIYAH